MQKSFKFSAKKVETAISDGLSALGRTLDEVEVKIISSGGLFKKAEVELVIEVAEESAIAKEPVAVSASPKAAPTQTSAHSASKKVESESRVSATQANAPPSAPKKSLFAKKDGGAQALPPRMAQGQQGQSVAKPASQQGQQSGQSVAPKKSLFAPKSGVGTGDTLQKPHKNFPRKSRGDRIVATPEMVQKAEGFLSRVLELCGIEGTVTSENRDGLNLHIATEDSAVIGHRGEVLDALQYLTGLSVNGGADKYATVSLDALGYRARRLESLRRLATKMAEKCINTSRRIGLEPMNSADRKEIHAFLAETAGVITKSEGHEPNRRIVIYPERKK